MLDILLIIFKQSSSFVKKKQKKEEYYFGRLWKDLVAKKNICVREEDQMFQLNSFEKNRERVVKVVS